MIAGKEEVVRTFTAPSSGFLLQLLWPRYTITPPHMPSCVSRRSARASSTDTDAIFCVIAASVAVSTYGVRIRMAYA